jgi:hypothetical protein
MTRRGERAWHLAALVALGILSAAVAILVG